MTATTTSPWDLVAQITDPEIPVISIADLGILRAVEVQTSGQVVVTITPTYSGCPAMQAIRDDVTSLLNQHGYADVLVQTVLAPAWTTDWITETGLRALHDFGIAPPGKTKSGPIALNLSICCPQCGSLDTEMLSRFGSTSCKSLYRCNSCREPFDSFKTL